MNENERIKVDYLFFEGEMARAERHVKRWQFASRCSECTLNIAKRLNTLQAMTMKLNHTNTTLTQEMVETLISSEGTVI